MEVHFYSNTPMALPPLLPVAVEAFRRGHQVFYHVPETARDMIRPPVRCLERDLDGPYHPQGDIAVVNFEGPRLQTMLETRGRPPVVCAHHGMSLAKGSTCEMALGDYILARHPETWWLCLPFEHPTHDLSGPPLHPGLRVVGWPKADQLVASSPPPQEWTHRRRHRIRCNILYAPTFTHFIMDASLDLVQWAEAERERNLAALVELAQNHPDWLIFISPHKGGAYLKGLDRLPEFPNLEVAPGFDSAQLMGASHLLITDVSGCLWEWLVLDRPVVMLSNIPSFLQPYQPPVGPRVEPEDLELAIEESLADPGKFQAARLAERDRAHAFVDGSCCRRAVDALEAAAGERKNC